MQIVFIVLIIVIMAGVVIILKSAIQLIISYKRLVACFTSAASFLFPVVSVDDLQHHHGRSHTSSSLVLISVLQSIDQGLYHSQHSFEHLFRDRLTYAKQKQNSNEEKNSSNNVHKIRFTLLNKLLSDIFAHKLLVISTNSTSNISKQT